MTCPNCNDQGFRESAERKNGVTSTVYTLCRCKIGTQLEGLWVKHPAWVGAPYSFFQNEDYGKQEHKDST